MIFQHFTEQEFYRSSDYAEIIKELENKPNVLVLKSGMFKFLVSGIIIVQDYVLVIFPKGYIAPKDIESFKSETYILLQTLMRYVNENNLNPDESELLFGNGENVINRIASSMLIIEDFEKYGLINRSKTISSPIYPGRIEWSTTIRKTTPYQNHGRTIYLTPIMNHNVNDTNDSIRAIHEYVVDSCINLWGWLLGYTEEIYVDELPMSLEEAIYILDIARNDSYVQRESTLFSLLIEYLKALSGNFETRRYEIFATPYFSFVWEAICGHVFENQYASLKVLVPQPIWVSDVIEKSVSQRPDSLFISGDRIFILDAKYYDYKISVPGWHDIVKQVFYKYTIEKHMIMQSYYSHGIELKNISNIFMLPGNEKYDFTYLGYAEVEGIPELGKIQTFTMDLRKAMFCYAFRRRDDLREVFIKEYQNIYIG